jgi:ABC-type antimicrobial peptide transport system permease subunit
MSNGAPIEAQVTSGAALGGIVFEFGPRVSQESLRIKPSLVNEFRAVPGVGRVTGLTYSYQAKTSDMVDVRSANVGFFGLTGSLNGIVFSDRVEFLGTGPEALDRIMAEKNTAIISEGLAQHLNVPLGGTIRVTGRGLDHVVEMRVVGIARKMPGFFSEIGRNQQTARQGSSSALVSLDTFREIAYDPVQGKLDADLPVLMRFMATTAPGVSLEEVGKALRTAFALKHKMVVSVTEEDIRLFQQQFKQGQVFMIVLTVISFVTAIFGVFAVIYVAVNSRRMEIGMMKAVGSPNGHLLLTFILEAAVMSVSAVLAGISAGAALGYFNQYSSSLTSELPVTFAVDTLVAPLTVALVVVASIISAAIASRAVLTRKAVQIIREAQ